MDPLDGTKPSQLERAWAEAGRALGRALSLTVQAAARDATKAATTPGDDTASELPLTMSVQEAAQVLGISRAAAYELVHRQELRSVRIGRRIVVPRAAVAEFLDRGHER